VNRYPSFKPTQVGRGYKVMRINGESPYQSVRWPLPRAGKPGAWVRVKGELEVCINGLHYCDRVRYLWTHKGNYVNHAVYRFEVVEVAPRRAMKSKRVARYGRLVRLVSELPELCRNDLTFLDRAAAHQRRVERDAKVWLKPGVRWHRPTSSRKPTTRK
jgi:hypothetical protein